MNLPFASFKLKKLPFYLLLLLLTVGASLILGFLSFGGMYALFPILILAAIAFGVSVLFDFEIYMQNIKGALNKLLKNEYLEDTVIIDFLVKYAPQNTKEDDCPSFFKEYHEQLEILQSYGHKKLNKASQDRKKLIEKKVKDLRMLFRQQLLNPNIEPEDSDYVKEIKTWLATLNPEEAQQLLESRDFKYSATKVFSVLAGIFMTLGSTYLIVEAFAVVPFLAVIPFTFWPLIILPMAVIAGAAYGLLTYNAITDLINNDTVLKWYHKIRDDLSQGVTPKNLLIAGAAIILAGLAIGLTICTAGTWWTVASHGRPLFNWMTKLPRFVMGIINPIINGLSTIFFNIQNTSESLELLDEALKSKVFKEGNLHEMLDLPESKEGYENSYIFCKDKERLYFINHHGSAKKIKIKDFYLFNSVLDQIKELELLDNALKSEVFERHKFHELLDLPENTEGYENSYIFCKNKGRKGLYFINLYGTTTKIKVKDCDLFNPVLEQIKEKGQSNILFLNADHINKLIVPNEGRSLFRQTYKKINNAYQHLRAKENWLQILNPFRIILKLTITPLRILLFFAHLVSLALTSDRMPGVPQIVSILLAIVTEGFEDAHYFVDHAHHHHADEHDFRALLTEHLSSHSGHNHDLDFPTLVLRTLFIPIYALAAAWDAYFGSKDFMEAWDKQRGNPREKNVDKATSSSEELQKELLRVLIEKFQAKHLNKVMIGKDLAQEKYDELEAFKDRIKNSNDLEETLRAEKDIPIYNQHRHFQQAEKMTKTRFFIEKLPQRVM